jgi:hypothetical protein
MHDAGTSARNESMITNRLAVGIRASPLAAMWASPALAARAAVRAALARSRRLRIGSPF